MLKEKKTNEYAIIKVIGIGGGGCNAIEHMIKEKITGVEFFAINTDEQALKKIEVEKKIQIGNRITKGLGAGANPEIGKRSAEEDQEILKNILKGADMVFIAAGMGGGTGTGAAPIIARIAKELGILTVSIVTKPFNFEGKKRIEFAEIGIQKLSKTVDSLIVIPNDKLIKVLSKEISLLNAFSEVNNILKGAIQSIAQLITQPGLINVDFADVRTVMSEMGYAMMGIGTSSGKNRAEEATETAISSPLLEDVNLSGAKGVLVNITANSDLKLNEFETIGNIIRSFSSDHATIVIGTSLDSKIKNTIKVTVIATGIEINFSHERNDISFKKSKQENILKNSNIELKDPIFFRENKKKKEKLINSKFIVKKNIEYLDIPTFLRKK
ncbi:cell division protein FtsZ [Buchnera aphidicola (Mindarus keteleerifoliae)]|uniref:cell division protein FtsZ n=1 Tax=Buchnera aphidicola TaxID=9 RepID=UPI0031B683C9